MAGYKVYDFKAEEFNGLSVPVHRVKKNILTSFPALALFPEFMEIMPGLNKDKVLSYIVYMYDYRSPLRTKIEDLKLRKYNAILLAGYSVEASTKEIGFSKEVNEVLLNLNEKVMAMIFRYAMWHRGGRYSYLVSLQEGAYAAQQRLINGDIGSLNALKNLNVEIDQVASELLGEDNMNGLTSNFLDYIALESLGISPEEVAQARRNGEDFLIGIDPYKRHNAKKEVLTSIKEKHEKMRADKYGF